MPRNGVFRALPFVALVAILFPGAVRADHYWCGMEVDPSSGLAGTTFTFINGTFPINLRLYREGDLVREVSVDPNAIYEMTAGRSDVGRWRAQGEFEGCPDLVDESFTVLGPPDTATAPGDTTALTAGFVLLVAAAFGSLAFVRRLPSRRPITPLK